MLSCVSVGSVVYFQSQSNGCEIGVCLSWSWTLSSWPTDVRWNEDISCGYVEEERFHQMNDVVSEVSVEG